MTAPANWGQLVTPRDVHTPPSEVAGAQLPSQTQLLEWGRNLIEGIVKEVVRLVTGVLLPGPAGQQLADWAFGLIDSFDTIFGAFDGIDLSNPQAVLTAIFDAVEEIPVIGDFAQLLENLVNGGQPLNVLNLFGSTTNASLLSNGGFDGAVSMVGGGLWDWDSATGHTTNGSARTTANSTTKALLSNSVAVTAGQSIATSVWVKGSGYTGSGTPIRLAVRTYLNGTPVGTTNIQSIAGPGGTWTQMSGSYTVPSGVNAVRLRLVVDSTATGGTIWFDDGSVTKSGNGPFGGILDLFNLSDLEDLFSLNPVTIWTAVINLFLKPSNLLASLVGGFLPDSQRPQLLQDALDSIVDVFNTGSQGSSSGNNLATMFLSMLGIHRTGTGAQSQNLVQDSLISKLLTGGSGLSDTFDGASATSLPSANWEQTYSGSGGGTSGLNGSGAAEWKTSGASTRTCLNRFKTPLTTDTQLVAVTLNSNLGTSTIGNNPEMRLQGRMNSTHDAYVEARFNRGSAEIGYVVSGTYTRLGATQSVSGNTAGTWQLKLGTVSSSREFVLLLNNVTVMTRTDSGASSQLGSSYWYSGFSQVAGVQWLGGILFFQMGPPDIESFGASDRLANL